MSPTADLLVTFIFRFGRFGSASLVQSLRFGRFGRFGQFGSVGSVRSVRFGRFGQFGSVGSDPGLCNVGGLSDLLGSNKKNIALWISNVGAENPNLLRRSGAEVIKP